ncbi:hypothetical protein Ddye_029256 [Dipteronia dyeriana]|uniref:DDE Tnp4 domain-containing protein n=1 Tax=Dipteronia dyeriana TaxID=168575 RepID=A0AAD9TE32_9ROSI|nr:hypothetical protein Ddye_029256 [Dipteronia dyeriana]
MVELKIKGEGAWAQSTNCVANDGEDMSYNIQNSKVERMHDIEKNLNNDFDHVDGLENIEINIGSPTYVNITEDNGREKRKTFRSRDNVTHRMLTHLDCIAKAMEFFENLDDNEHENNERDDANEHSDSDDSKYYLGDAGYPRMKGYLGPCKGERYHLPDYRRAEREKRNI